MDLERRLVQGWRLRSLVVELEQRVERGDWIRQGFSARLDGHVQELRKTRGNRISGAVGMD